MKTPALALVCLLLAGCEATPVAFTVGYKDASFGMTWQPRPSDGKNPISRGDKNPIYSK